MSKQAHYAEPQVIRCATVSTAALKKHARALDTFLNSINADADFVQISSARTNPNCGVFLTGEAAAEWQTDDLPCLGAARDSLGNWTVLTETGRVVQFLADVEVL